MNKLMIFGLSLALSSGAFGAAAEDFDGSQPLLCASLEAHDCGPGGDCLSGTAKSINAPQFIRIDFEQKQARARRPDGEERTTTLDSVRGDEGKLILQGVQSGLGWSMSITQESGEMALTAAGDRVAYVVFGACTPL